MTAKTDETSANAIGAAGAVGAIGYEQARDELIEVVRRLEAGGTTLEESLALWERGEELAKVCRRWLDGARARLDAALAERDAGEAAGRGGVREGDGVADEGEAAP
ncbi:exodeoxyribonuclease VII small subunit [Streptomyces sp. FIT100]|uniref:exodeoxyribonuclease VII small subunit n=1 Tax=Streptomyces sp. FIT100 TaxID=2837956 RepID=UPI0021C70282|nr:exodeoxyribonuclease VII small subunit [Streptomyces sp. FIT100]UUN28957.1 exodeoxyribonuclease VII small subunit [Streptomyces sp. FIT100]